MKRFCISLSLLVGLTVSLAAQSVNYTADYRVNPLSNASFRSDMPLEVIIGNTNEIISEMSIHPENLLEAASGKVVVHLQNLKTGIERRDIHLHEVYLETHKYSTATFELKSIKNVLTPNLLTAKHVNATLVGDVTIHGTTHSVEIPAEFHYIPAPKAQSNQLKGNFIRLHAEFMVDPTQYGVPLPDNRNYRMAKEMKIEMNIVYTDHNSDIFEKGSLDYSREDILKGSK